MAKKSDWLNAREDKSKPECSMCDGTGSAGKDKQGNTIPCSKCGGFGF